MEKYFGYFIILLVSLYLLYLFHFKLLKHLDMQRIAKQFTSSRRFMVFLSGYLVLISLYGIIFHIITEEVFKTILTFCGAISGIGVIAVGGEKIANNKFKKNE